MEARSQYLSMPRFPVSVKGVIFRGGRMEPGESPEECLRREAREELGLSVGVGPLLHAWTYPVLPGREVFVVSYGCYDGGGRVSRSAEHAACGWFAPEELPGLALPEGYREAIRVWLGGEDSFVRPWRTPV